MPLLTADQVAATLRRGGSARVDADVPARFRVGQRVAVRNEHPFGHTRAPRYLRGRRGTIVSDHGVFVFPDSHAANGDRNPQHVYSVRFDARELWGTPASARDAVYADLWDDYLLAADR